MLTTHALPTSLAPITAKLVRERLLCQEMPPPPPSLNISPPPVDPNLSTRDRYLAHSADPVCAGCHSRIDPIGSPASNTTTASAASAPWTASTTSTPAARSATAQTNGTYDGVDELAQLLAGSPEVQACYTLQWSRFAVGSAENSELLCVQDELDEAFMASEGKLDSLCALRSSTPASSASAAAHPTRTRPPATPPAAATPPAPTTPLAATTPRPRTPATPPPAAPPAR